MLKLKPCWEVISGDNHCVIFNLVTGRILRIPVVKNSSVLFVLSSLEEGIEKRDLFKNLDTREKKEITSFLKKLESLNVINSYSSTAKIEEYPSKWRKFDRQYHYLSALEQQNLGRFEIQDRIRNTRVAVLGVGSTGQWLIPALIESGFQKFVIVDFDCVEEKNLVAQVMFSRKDVGKKKIDAVYKKMKDMNPELDIVRVHRYLKTENDVMKIVKSCDIVAHCCDMPRFTIHRVIARACSKLKKPNIVIESGKLGPFHVPGKTPCYLCLEKYMQTMVLLKTLPS